MRGVVRVLGPNDPEGRELGDDWLVASFGYADGAQGSGEYHLTTDHLHGTDVPEVLQFADTTAKLVAALVNAYCAGKIPSEALGEA